ncbi:TetR/AcrR family transcriptional regulator [Mycobacterium sp. IDR2000157661]|nr:TetR/AcrR family transcriptional regulator [Mycobacterium sp. IDR2000157661]
MISAARALFVEQGYGAATVEAISNRSDVPPATVYRLFGSKLGILKAILDVSIGGDDEPVAMPDRTQVRQHLADPDPQTQLAGFVAVTSEVNSRTAAMYRVLVGAASSDRGAAGLLEEINRQRHAGQGQVVRALARAGAVRHGLAERDAADIVFALMSPEVYRLLVLDRGWPPRRYERWLTETIAASLLARDE